MYVLKLSCTDRPGLVSAVSSCLYQTGCNIEEASQFHEPEDNMFFMRILFSGSLEKFTATFKQIAANHNIDWNIDSVHVPIKTIILLSQWDHCLHDLLYRASAGHLNIEITGVISNHTNTKEMVERHSIPFHFLDIPVLGKQSAEQQIKDVITTTDSDLIVLARYMQILSDEFCNTYKNRLINIHHSFLPGFKGAKPYHQAYSRGVKIIGASAHFVTSDLDEGPIIAQGVENIDHTYTPEKMMELGRDIERQTLAKTVRLYADHRIFLHNKRTVIL